jgi:hypothetical protein
MPIDFDALREKEDRGIVIRGERFTVQYVTPATMDKFEAVQNAAAARKGEITWAELAASYSERIKLMIDDGNGSVDRWQALVDGDKIAYSELKELANRVVEMATDFPTMPPSVSGSGGERSAASSRAGSS